MKQQRPAGSAERQVAKLLEIEEIGIGEASGELVWLALVSPVIAFDGVL
jgi:hypothetical protein